MLPDVEMEREEGHATHDPKQRDKQSCIRRVDPRCKDDDARDEEDEDRRGCDASLARWSMVITIHHAWTIVAHRCLSGTRVCDWYTAA